MKYYCFLFILIFSSMNVFPFSIWYPNETVEAIKLLSDNSAIKLLSDNNCDAEFAKDLIYSLTMPGGHELYSTLCKDLKKDPDINLAFIKNSPFLFESIDHKLISNYDEAAKTAVKTYGRYFKFVKTDYLSSAYEYDEVARIALKNRGNNLKYVKPDALSSRMIYDEAAKAAVKDWGGYLQFVKTDKLSSPEIYDGLASNAVKKQGLYLQFVNPIDLSNLGIYETLAETAVNKWGGNLQYVKPEHVSEKLYDELSEIASKEKSSLEYITPYDELILTVARKHRVDLSDVSVSNEEIYDVIIKLNQCNYFERPKRSLSSKCKTLKQWLRDYDAYEKEKKADSKKDF